MKNREPNLKKPVCSAVHKVAAGETLYRIARRYGVDYGRLMAVSYTHLFGRDLIGSLTVDIDEKGKLHFLIPSFSVSSVFSVLLFRLFFVYRDQIVTRLPVGIIRLFQHHPGARQQKFPTSARIFYVNAFYTGEFFRLFRLRCV